MITVVTICLNSETTIRATMLSVLAQKDAKIDYIIKDGKSSDDTNNIIEEEILKNHNADVSIKHIISDDSGIYQAMNQAVCQARGEWIIFMNAGDYFYNPYVLRDISYYMNDESNDIIYGNTLFSLDKTYCFVQIHNVLFLSQFFSLGHQSLFTRTEIMKKYLFNEYYKIAGDYDLFVRLMNAGKNFQHVNMIISICNREGISSQKKIQMYRESHEIKYGIGSARGIMYNINLLIWLIKAIIARLFPVLEKYRFCKNSMKRFKNIIWDIEK